MKNAQTLNANAINIFRLPRVNTCLKDLDLKKIQRIFRGTETASNEFLKPARNMTTPLIGKAVGAKTKNLQLAKTTSDFLKYNTGGKILSFTDIHAHGLNIKIGWINSNILSEKRVVLKTLW